MISLLPNDLFGKYCDIIYTVCLSVGKRIASQISHLCLVNYIY